MIDNVRSLDQQRERLRLEMLKSGSGGGGTGDDGARLVKVEMQIAALDKRLDDLKASITKIDDKMLTKWDMAQVVFYVVGAIMAAIVLGPRLAPLLTP